MVIAHEGLTPGRARLLPEGIARREQVVPLTRTPDRLTVAALRHDRAAIERVSQAAGCAVNVRLVFDPLEIAYGLALVYGDPEAAAATLQQQVGWNLVRLGYVSAGAYRDRLDRLGPGSLTGALVEERIISDDTLAQATAFTLHLPHVRLGAWPQQPALARVVPRRFAETHTLAPFALYRGRLLVAVAGVETLSVLREAARAAGYPIAPVIASQSSIQSALRVAWGTRDEDEEERAAADTPDAMLGITQSEAALRVDPQAAALLPAALVRRFGGLPVARRRNRIVLAAHRPPPPAIIETYQLLLGRPVDVVRFPPDAFERLQDTHFPPPEAPPEVLFPDRWWASEESFEEFMASLGYLSAEQADAARRLGRERPGLVRRVLMESGALTEDTLAEGLGLWLGMPWLEVDQWLPEPNVLGLVPKETALRLGTLPLLPGEETLTVATSAPDNRNMVGELADATGRAIRLVVAARSPLNRTLRRWYETESGNVAPEFIDVSASLIQAGRLTATDRTYWAEMALRSSEAPDRTAVRLGIFSEEDLAPAIAAALRLPYESLLTEERYEPVVEPDGGTATLRIVHDPVQARAAQLLSPDDVRSHGAVPLRRQGGELVVAFAWPSQEAVAAVAELVGEPVRPVVARRSHIEAAIARHAGRPRLGDIMLSTGLVRADQIDQAAAHAARNGLRLGAALLSLGYITEAQLVASLAAQADIPHFDVVPEMVDQTLLELLPKAFVRERQVLPVARDGDDLLVAIVDPLDTDAFQEVARLTGLRVNPVLVSASAFTTGYQAVFQEEDIHSSSSELLERTPQDSAARVLSDGQKAFGLAFLVVMVLLFAWQPLTTLIAVVTIVNLLYLCISFYRFYLIFNGMGRTLEIEVSATEVGALDERDLPVYTILVPLYRETAVLPRLVESIARLDYPKAKLDVKLLLEEDDVETVAVARAAGLPSHFSIVVVPNRPPKGKPKACNFGLLQAKGSYVVIFDAEDVPEPDQLKRVIIAFRKGDKDLGCVQCKLNYYNRDQNLLTRWFTSEYSMWFDLFLPGLNAVHAPVPLGGTSNHFPTLVLQDLGAWDPYNVTEDADLGIRLFKRGYTTAVVDSTTFEEANSEIYNWIRQRSRWVKGYIQTWLVHMRNPVALYRAIGFRAFFSIQMTIFGTFFTFLVNPIFWGLTMVWFLIHWNLIAELFPSPMYYIGAISLFAGNFIFTYLAMMGCLYRGYFSLVKYAVPSMLYWYLMSFASWKGFLQLFHNPFYWEKTEHGLYHGPVPDASRGGMGAVEG